MRRTWIIIGIIMLLFTMAQIISTYAKYTTGATATVQKQAGAWVIKVNNEDITLNNGLQKTFNINGLTYPENEYVVENKLAPASSGYFDIVIDPTGSSVAIRFDVTLDVQNLNAFDSIRFTSAYRVVNGEEVSQGIVKTGTNTYSGVISLNDVRNEVASTIRFYIGWDEEETDEGDESDSELGSLKDVTTSLPVNVVVTQYLGETISTM